MPSGKPKVVLVPGASARGIMWKHAAERLAGLGREVYAVSLPGHGESDVRPKPLGRHTLGDFADALGDFISQVGICDLWAHSLGGAVAQLQFGSCSIRKVALFNSVAPRTPLVSKPDVALRALKYTREMLWGGEFHYQRRDYFALLLNRTSEAEREEIFAGIVPESGWAVGQVCAGLLSMLRLVCVKEVIVVASDADLVTPAYMADKLVAKYRKRGVLVKRMTLAGDHMRVFSKFAGDDVARIEEALY